MSTTIDIRQLFNTIAARYDITNALISFGCHTLWYRRFIHTILSESIPHAVLDLCCGTGAVTERLAATMTKRRIPLPTIDCVDFSDNMLEGARQRLHRLHVVSRFINSDAALLPLPDNSYDTIIVAYGIRNLTEKKKALSEARRVLKPHGKLFILELTSPSLPVIRLLHTAYLKTAVPLLGALLTRHKKPYQYLEQSIKNFSVPDLLSSLEQTGFSASDPVSLSFGVATIIQAEKI
jgi:demethylmenaquinone methyltransferase / 2-methoxy-6-polyprenyl-1,4-benzoquinol methylase